MMPNAFLVTRTVFFALLLCFHVFTLVFASLNIAAAKSFGMSVPGASVFLLLNTIFIFVLVPVALLAERICPKARPVHVRIECAWTVLMSIFELAASIDVTVTGSSEYCHEPYPKRGLCASTSLLVQISWLTALIILSYCLTLCVAAATHATSLPEIWSTPVPRVPWFRPSAEETEAKEPASDGKPHPQAPTRTEKAMSTWSGESCAVSKYIAERWEKLSRTERQSVTSGPIVFKRGRQSVDATRPAWARTQSPRRGIDHPFARSLPRRKEPPPPVALPPLPPKAHSGAVLGPTGSRFVEGSETSSTLSGSTFASRMGHVFPHRIADPDLPIPRPNLTEWVRANGVHTKPYDSIV